MKIAVSADCFASFTSGFPVRGMMLELVRRNPDWQFRLYYTRRERPAQLESFYEEINSMPNVEVRYFNDSRKVMAIKRLLGLKYVTFDKDVDLFLSPGNPEYIRGFRGPSICSVADLSTIKGLSTGRYARFFKHWVKWQWGKTLPWTTAIVAISDFTRQDIANYFPKVASKVTTIYNGIDNHWFDKDVPKIDVNERFGISSPYFIWWGLISRRKNIDRLIEGYKIAKGIDPSLPKLLLIGKISEHMEHLRSELGQDIINIPFQENDTLRSFVRGSRGLIFPSLYEGFGLPVIEAFSQGINVACSDVTSLREVSGGHAILFDPHDPQQIADALLQLSNAPSCSGTLTNYAAQFTYRHSAAKYRNLIIKLLNVSRRGAEAQSFCTVTPAKASRCNRSAEAAKHS